MTLKLFFALAAALAVATPGVSFAADTLLKPVPIPDTSKLSPEVANELRNTRQEFEKIKPTLVGDSLIEAYTLLAADYARAGLYDAAAVALEDASLLAPNDARWVYAQGLIARMQKRNADAQSYFERAVVLNKDYLPIRVALVNIRIEQGDLEAARKLLTEFTATRDTEPVAYAMLGDIALRQKRYADAIEQTNLALKIDPNATKLYAQLADAYTGAGNAAAAAQARAKVGDGMPALGDPILLGLLAKSDGNAPPAGTANAPATATPAAAAKAPLSPERDATFLLATRQYEPARGRLDAALKQTPNDAALLGIYARVEAATGNFAKATARANAAVAAAPNSASAYLTLGFVLEMGNDDAGAQRAYEKAVQLDPKSAEANVRLGNLLMRIGRFDDAAVRYRAAAQIDPADGESWSRLVAAETAGGKCDLALRDVNAVLAKDAKNGVLMQLFVRLTSTCAKSGAEEKAMALDYAGRLYKQSDAAPIAEMYALAFAANGKWDDAVKTQQAAMFVLVRNGRRNELAPYRQFLQQFQAHKVPERPWASDSLMYRPQRPTPDAQVARPAAPAAPAPPPQK
ncbi:MAG: tetratricopeptide repeat protein [Rhodanobacteraceae bacterium]